MMATVDEKISWTVTLTNEEWLLVLKSLGNRIDNIAERENACALGNELTRLRSARLKDIVKVADRLDRVLTGNT